MFLFDIERNPIVYAQSIFFPINQYNLVEVEVSEFDSKIARVFHRPVLFSDVRSITELVGHARKYWSGQEDPGTVEEILFEGVFKYTKIINHADDVFSPCLKQVPPNKREQLRAF
jgi:hypothetical protein